MSEPTALTLESVIKELRGLQIKVAKLQRDVAKVERLENMVASLLEASRDAALDSDSL